MFMALCIMGNAILTLCIQVVAVRFMKRLITSDFMVSLNHDFIRSTGCLLSLIWRVKWTWLNQYSLA